MLCVCLELGREEGDGSMGTVCFACVFWLGLVWVQKDYGADKTVSFAGITLSTALQVCMICRPWVPVAFTHEIVVRGSREGEVASFYACIISTNLFPCIDSISLTVQRHSPGRLCI
ncbi:hypothetical protein BP00DRAFT_213469 [Aspergillus indologenus CBS 114.80]|uniref:Uncharacterized protein n=1 Tax=Aspergillus indologenus CBS 114.80 TaxID=1450541 RepID=A0A2V5I028_9EURO|nr:hypothetical protein BP00DRAFT_213469 [Aspergillus indologenus CBS 114.80]